MPYYYQHCRQRKRWMSVAQWLLWVSVSRKHSLERQPGGRNYYCYLMDSKTTTTCHLYYILAFGQGQTVLGVCWCIGGWITSAVQLLVYTDWTVTVCEWSHVRVPASLFLTCCGGLAQSVFQVRSTGSGLVHFGAALSGSQPGVQGVCGAQGEKKNSPENTNPSLRDVAGC